MITYANISMLLLRCQKIRFLINKSQYASRVKTSIQPTTVKVKKNTPSKFDFLVSDIDLVLFLVNEK